MPLSLYRRPSRQRRQLMWLSSMCALWRWGSAPPRPLRRPARGRPTAARLTVELLESRDLLSGFTLGPLVQVSGPSPFNGSPYQPEFGRNAETENFVAVDPTNPQHVVTAWFQDLAI